MSNDKQAVNLSDTEQKALADVEKLVGVMPNIDGDKLAFETTKTRQSNIRLAPLDHHFIETIQETLQAAGIMNHYHTSKDATPADAIRYALLLTYGLIKEGAFNE